MLELKVPGRAGSAQRQRGTLDRKGTMLNPKKRQAGGAIELQDMGVNKSKTMRRKSVFVPKQA